MKKAPPQPERFRWYTVELCMDEGCAYPRKEWKVHLGKVPSENLSVERKFDIQTVARTEDEARLQAKQKQGQEALLKLIEKGKANENPAKRS